MSLITALTNGLAGSTCRARINTALASISSVATEIAAGSKTGEDTRLVTGTAGATDSLMKWNADGDAVAAIAANIKGTESIIIAVGDETTVATTGTAKVTFRMPYAFTLTEIRASCTTGPTTSSTILDVNDSGTSIMTTNKLEIEATETTTKDATTQPALTDTALADDAVITIDIDSIGSGGGGAGYKVSLIGNRT